MSVKNHQKLARVRPDNALRHRYHKSRVKILFSSFSQQSAVSSAPRKEIAALLHPGGHREPEAMQDIGEGSISIFSVLKII